MDGELNPNHPTTRAVHDNWHKIAALLMLHFGKSHVVIPVSEIDKMEGTNIAIRFDDIKGIELFIVSNEQAKGLAKKEGGLPV